MSDIQTILERVNKLLEEPVNWDAINEVMVDLHKKLTDPQWAIEDPYLRKQMERMFVDYTAKEYLATLKENK